MEYRQHRSILGLHKILGRVNCKAVDKEAFPLRRPSEMREARTLIPWSDASRVLLITTPGCVGSWNHLLLHSQSQQRAAEG